MTSLDRPLEARSLSVTIFAGAGCVLFGYILFVMIRPLVMWPDEIFNDRDGIAFLSFPCAALMGLLLELRSFFQLAGKAESSIRNLWRVLEIHLRVFCGVLVLIVFTTTSLIGFPRAYERERILLTKLEDMPFDSDLGLVMFVAFKFVLIWVFIQLGLKLLEGVPTTLEKMKAPTVINAATD